MEHSLVIYNTLHRRKEVFVPLHDPNLGMYVCGPTVYGDPHLGHARPAITFDLLFRYLTHLGYKVRYVRNITDVGHLEHDADEGEDKIAKKARLEQLEPMEVAQYYTNRYHDAMRALNVLPPSIEPHASGHIIEQIQLVKEILDNGYAYESQGSVYFDVAKYNKDHHYGKLSGRNLEDVLNTSRELDGQEEKHNGEEFAGACYVLFFFSLLCNFQCFLTIFNSSCRFFHCPLADDAFKESEYISESQEHSFPPSG